MTCWTLVTQGTLGPVHPKNSSNCCRSTRGLVEAGTAKKFSNKRWPTHSLLKPFWLKNFQRHLAANLQHFWTKRRNRPNCGRPPVGKLFNESDWRIITSLTSIPARIQGRASLAAPWWSKLQLVLWQNTPSYYQPNLNCRLVLWCQHQNRSFLQYHVIYYPWLKKRQAMDLTVKIISHHIPQNQPSVIWT